MALSGRYNSKFKQKYDLQTRKQKSVQIRNYSQFYPIII